MAIEGPMHDDTLTDGCWDCECEHNYIHVRSREGSCPICGVEEDDQPDSHAHEAAKDPALRMTAKEAMELVGMCPFCHHSDVDEDNDGDCTCQACESSWKVERRLVGYSYTDKESDYHEVTEDPQDKISSLEEQVRILREALSDLCDSQLTSRDREDVITRGLAALEATKEGI